MRRLVQLFSFLLLASKKPNKFKNSSKIDGKFVKVFSYEKSAELISKDIDRLFPNHKGLVLEKSNFEWSKEELAVARAKGIIVN